MQKKHLVILISVLAVGSAAIAHEFPNDYDSAKEVCESSLMVSNGNWIKVRHLALHWRADIYQSIVSGRFVDTDYFGGHNWYRKWGSAEFPVDVEIDGEKVTKGNYTISIKSPKSDPAGLLLELKSGDTVVDLKLNTDKKSEITHDHLDVSVIPVGKENDRSR